MNIAISNIAWNNLQEKEVFKLLQKNNITCVEIAFTKICNWDKISILHLEEYRKKLRQFGLSCYNVQSLMYETNINIFENPLETRQHFRKIFELSKSLEIHNLIFGSPKNRISKNKKSDEDSFIHFLDFVEQQLDNTGIKFNIESNPKVYSCNFITTPSEALKFIEGRKNIGFHLDTACVELSNEEILEPITISSVHVSETNLSNFDKPKIEHTKYRDLLKRSGYDGNISIEMKETNLKSIQNSLEYVKKIYMGEK